jgi:hypothetical protein
VVRGSSIYSYLLHIVLFVLLILLPSKYSFYTFGVSFCLIKFLCRDRTTNEGEAMQGANNEANGVGNETN